MESKLKRKTVLIRAYSDKIFVLRLINACIFFIIVLIINFFAVRYATAHAGASLHDSLLDILPKVNTRFFHGYITLFIQSFIFFFALFFPDSLIFFIVSTSMLILVRDMFINMTYLGMPTGSVPVKSFFTQGGDLFFSGHTALPFMAALVYWHSAWKRYFFLFLSVIMGVQVLVGHYHYSVDVFAAYFVTYGVYAFSKKFFLFKSL